MRLFQLVLAVLAIAAMAAIVVAGGRALHRDESVVTVDQIQDVEAEPDAPATSADPQPAKPVMPSRAIDPEAVAPPPLRAEELVRVEPRAPLSDLALAGPPKPKMPDDWNGTKLFQPVATE